MWRWIILLLRHDVVGFILILITQNGIILILLNGSEFLEVIALV